MNHLVALRIGRNLWYYIEWECDVVVNIKVTLEEHVEVAEELG